MNTEFLRPQPSPFKLFISHSALPSWERLPGTAQEQILQTLEDPGRGTQQAVHRESQLREVVINGFRVYFNRSKNELTIIRVVTPREASRLGI